MVRICGVDEDSHAAAAGIRAGDMLVSINNEEISDVLDYRFYLTERVVALRLLRDGEPYTVSLHKREYDDIGLSFETPLMDKKHSCKNGCIFCFIDQNPKGMRESIYFKDDDSRLSFLHGNYITLTNMTDKDVARIVKMRFSPINISIHTTNPELRVKMMKNKRAGEVLRYLDVFKEAGLSLCGQIVLCHGINDGEELLRSMRDLSKYAPEMTSVSIVPTGLTKYREKLYPLTDFSAEEAGEVIDAIDRVGSELKERIGTRLFFAADEFYLKAGRPIPSADYYEGYPQLENGVGMLRSFADDFSFAAEDVATLAAEMKEDRKISVATGVAAYPLMASLCQSVEKICPHLKINVYKIINHFFGESITVAGLLTGRDFADELSGQDLGEELLIPANALRSGEDVFLCGMHLPELEEKLGVRVTPTENDGYAFLYRLFGKDA